MSIDRLLAELRIELRFWAGSDRQNVQKEAAEPADSLRLGLGAAAALLDPHVGDLRRRRRVAGLDRARVDLAREAQHVDVVVDADLLLAGDSRWPFGSTPVTVAVIVPEKSLLFSVLPLPAKLLLEVPAARWRG